MKIINQRIRGEYQFECWNCKTTFAANDDEYAVEADNVITNKKRVGFFLNEKYIMEYTPTWILKCRCPVCERTAKHTFPTGEPKYERQVYYD